MSKYLKVGRLLPGKNATVRIMKDGSGEIGIVTKADLILVCGGLELIPVEPTGEMDPSTSGKAVKFTVNGVLFVAFRNQGVGMINE